MHEKNVLTVFSAPNYLYRVGNHAAVMELDDSLKSNLVQFDAAPCQKDVNIPKHMPGYFI